MTVIAVGIACLFASEKTNSFEDWMDIIFRWKTNVHKHPMKCFNPLKPMFPALTTWILTCNNVTLVLPRTFVHRLYDISSYSSQLVNLCYDTFLGIHIWLYININSCLSNVCLCFRNYGYILQNTEARWKTSGTWLDI